MAEEVAAEEQRRREGGQSDAVRLAATHTHQPARAAQGLGRSEAARPVLQSRPLGDAAAAQPWPALDRVGQHEAVAQPGHRAGRRDQDGRGAGGPSAGAQQHGAGRPAAGHERVGPRRRAAARQAGLAAHQQVAIAAQSGDPAAEPDDGEAGPSRPRARQDVQQGESGADDRGGHQQRRLGQSSQDATLDDDGRRERRRAEICRSLRHQSEDTDQQVNETTFASSFFLSIDISRNQIKTKQSASIFHDGCALRAC